MSDRCGSLEEPEVPALKVFTLSATRLNSNVTTYSTLGGSCKCCCGDKPECPEGAVISDTCRPVDGLSVFEWSKLVFFKV
jgi:hypothetical protein